MLVLSRRPGEVIVIPSLGVTIQVVEVRGDRVRIGVEAPREIGVHRKEVWERIAPSQAVIPTACTHE